MTDHDTIRLLIDPPQSGSLNMSIDQSLLISAAETGTATLRIYHWQPATLSLGYFQNVSSRDQHKASRDCPVVRRASGGGAIVHDRELTYSLAIPAADRWAIENRNLFDTVHQTLIESLHELGISGLSVVQRAPRESKSGPFLCFQRRSPGDVELQGEKVIGSAQRRLKNALLQHGSLLLEQSPCAPELPGISDLAPATVDPTQITSQWPKKLAEVLGYRLTRGALTDVELQSAKSIESGKFAHDSWTLKR